MPWMSMCTVWLTYSKWVNRAMNLHQIWHWVWPFLCRNYLDDSEGCHYGSWWLEASSWQGPHSCITSGAEYCGETSNHPGDSAPLQPTFGPLWLLAFPQTKTTIESKEISECQWDSEKYDRAAHGDWENCVRSQGAYSEGDWGVIVLCTMFLVFCIFFSKCLYFS